jgi:hypothetical protein
VPPVAAWSVTPPSSATLPVNVAVPLVSGPPIALTPLLEFDTT